jgi:hypothetical protein
VRNWGRIRKQDRDGDDLYAGSISFTDETAAILPGIIVRPGRVHAPCRQVIAVATARGQVILAWDAMHYYANGELTNPYPVIVNVLNYLS